MKTDTLASPKKSLEAPNLQIHVAAFYQFAIDSTLSTEPIDRETVASFAKAFETKGRELGLKGLMITADEGVNGTISGLEKAVVQAFLDDVTATLKLSPFTVKWSIAGAWPFRKFKVRIRQEIVTSGDPSIKPPPVSHGRHLSPTEWQKTLDSEDVVVLDTRNWYETDIGKFKGAVDPRMNEFQEFDGYLDQVDIPKEKKILIYCTGGIRCEKAIVEMDKKGFRNVYQLEGGILNYLAQYPEQAFEGECFVFDNRVAVDQHLQPSSIYTLCPHCGQPASETLACLRCDTQVIICPTCAAKEATRTCSKNCAHHYAMAPGKKGRNQREQAVPSAVKKRARLLNAQRNRKVTDEQPSDAANQTKREEACP